MAERPKTLRQARYSRGVVKHLDEQRNRVIARYAYRAFGDDGVSLGEMFDDPELVEEMYGRNSAQDGDNNE